MISEENYENYMVRRQLADASEIGKLREKLSAANAKIAKLEQENRDADLLLGDTWRDVISTMHGNGGSVESALRQQLHNLSANLRIANAKIIELQQAATTLQQLEELLHTHSLVSFEKIVGNYQMVLPNTGWAWVRKDLPAAVAAAWEMRSE